MNRNREPSLGSRGTPERRQREREAIVDAYLELELGSAKARASASLESGYIGHEKSPLGPRRHKAAVRRRIAAWRASGARGAVDAAIVGGRFLLTIDALADEYFRPTESRRATERVVWGAVANDNTRGGR